ncbi:MAG: VCBS repeat domain-containing M23 family metallopeptidase [Patescibacteria group bacterium]
MSKYSIAMAVIAVLGLNLLPFMPAAAQVATVRDIVFPIIGSTSRSDDFGAPRSGHTHEGNDIFAKKMSPAISAVDGVVQYVYYPEPSWGYSVTIEDAAGWQYNYLHLNNDAPGTDNGTGVGPTTYAPGMVEGAAVKKGQLIGYVGDSGNAENTSPHLHFEIRQPDGTAIDPAPSLSVAEKIEKPVVRDPVNGELIAYGSYTGGANVAVGDVSLDNEGEELITGALAGGKPNVKVYSAEGRLLEQFYAYAKDFRGGVDVATGDVNGDGQDDIITGPGPGSEPRIKVFTGKGHLLYQFNAGRVTTRQGLRVAAADLTGDGIAQIITAPISGVRPLVRIYTRKGRLVRAFMAYSEKNLKGLDVAAYAAAANSPAVIVTGTNRGAGPLVRVFTADGKVRHSFYAYDRAFHGGVRVAVAEQYGNIRGPEIYTAPATSGGPDFRVYSLRGNQLDSRQAFEEWWHGSYDIAIGNETAYTASGPEPRRRTSVWQLE